MKRITVLLAVLCLCLAAGAAAAEGGLLYLHQIAIGHADAYLLTVGDTVVIVDAGLDTDSNVDTNGRLFGYFDALGIDHVDAHFVTHWHNDHAYNVTAINETGGGEDTVVYGPSPELPAVFQPLAHGCYRQLKDGDRVTVGPLEILCVGPAAADLDGYNNRHSLNFIVSYGAHRFMFTGDWVDGSVNSRWREEITDIDVLSFPHHGMAPICMTSPVIRTMSPRVVLIPGPLKNEKNVKNFMLNESSVRFYPRFYSNNDGNILVISDGVTLRTAYGVSPGELPAGKEVKERKR